MVMMSGRPATVEDPAGTLTTGKVIRWASRASGIELKIVNPQRREQPRRRAGTA
jgi:hypothetical protein